MSHAYHDSSMIETAKSMDSLVSSSLRMVLPSTVVMFRTKAQSRGFLHVESTPMKMCCARMKPLAALAYEVGALRLMKRSRHKPRFSHIHFFISEAASFLHQPRQGRLHCKKHLLSQVLFAWWRLMGSPVCGRAGSAGKRATGTFSNTPPFEPIFPICRRRHRPAGGVFFWWRLMGSNHRPHACEACALTS